MARLCDKNNIRKPWCHDLCLQKNEKIFKGREKYQKIFERREENKKIFKSYKARYKRTNWQREFSI